MDQLTQKIEDRSAIDNSDIIQIVKAYLPLKKKGKEHVGVCPFHNDKHASLMVNKEKQIFKCFACGEGGDVVDFLMKMGATSFREAVNEIKSASGNISNPVQNTVEKKDKPQWEVIIPAPGNAPSPDFHHYRHGHPAKIWPYKLKDGLLLGYVCRFDLEDGNKETLPMTFAKSGDLQEWRWKGFPEKRPLYGLDKDKGTKNVVIFEGEKTKDAAVEKFPKNDVFSWPGGTNAIHLVDWSPLYGRNVVLFPDNDLPGWLAMVGGYQQNKQTKKWTYKKGIADLLKDHCPKIQVVTTNKEFPKGWDIADVNWSSEESLRYAKSRLKPLEEVQQKSPPEEKKKPESKPKIKAEDPKVEEVEKIPFRCLGYSKTESGQNEFHVYSNRASQALRFTSQSLNKSSMMLLAHTSFWENRFHQRKDGFDVDAASEFVIDRCYQMGVYDADNLRGIGAWVDEGRVVIHAGDRLIVEGKKVDLTALETKYIYEANKPFGFELKTPHTMHEANKLFQLFDLMSWERPINAYLLAGWCIIAPVCGALNWRPHLWLTGGAGTGKSTIFGIIRIVVGRLALAVQGTTTEAGIRQELQQDARPVIFDEMDNDSDSDTKRIQAILATVRASSSFDGGKIIKGGAMGTNKAYKIRSCFAFASISPQISTTADKSRVTILSLKKQSAENFNSDNWSNIQRQIAEIIHPDWSDQLISRTIKLLPVILENARIFTRASANHLGEQRSGDQLGVLLAGVYSLFSNQVIEYDKAKKWVEEKDWSDIQSDEKDEVNLFNCLIGATFAASTSAGSKIEKTIGELILIATQGQGRASLDEDMPHEFMIAEDASDNLRRLGVRVEEESFVVANNSNWIHKTLMGTPWAKGHGKVLLRIPGATATQSTTFAPGIKGRGVSLPVSLVKMEGSSE